MKVYLFIALLPCIWAAGSKNIQCPDGSLCSFGKTCCESNDGSFHCCDLAEEERYNKKLVPAFSPGVSRNPFFDTCEGTNCFNTFCCNIQSAVCCSSNSFSCCPNSYQCCGSTNMWCCKQNQRCATAYMYCIAGAASLSPGFVAMIMIVIVAVTFKRV